MPENKIDIEFLYWAFINLEPSLSDLEGSVGPSKWDSSTDIHVQDRGRGIITYEEFEKEVLNIFGKKPDKKIFKIVQVEYNKMLEKRSVDPNTPGEIRLREMVESESSSSKSRRKQKRAENLAKNTQELANKRPSNFLKDAPTEIYFKPESDNFIETQELTVVEAQNLLERVKNVHEDPSNEYENVKRALSQSFKNSSFTDEQTEQASRHVALATTQALAKIEPLDIQSQIDETINNNLGKVHVPFFDPLGMMETLTDNTRLMELVPDPEIRKRIIEIASTTTKDLAKQESLSGSLVEEYLGKNTAYLLFPSTNPDREKPKFTTAPEEDTGSVGKTSIKDLEQYATLSWLATKTAEYAGVNLEEESKKAIINAVNRRIALQKYIKESLKNDASLALGIETSRIVEEVKERNEILRMVQGIISQIQEGETLKIALATGIEEKTAPLVSFSASGGLDTNFLSVFGVIGKETIRRTIGKKVTQKAAAFVAKKIGTKIATGAVASAAGGPLGIALTIISFAKDIISYVSKKIKKHPEILALPVFGLGLILGMPGLAIGGIGGGLILASGGIRSAAIIVGSSIGKIAATFASFVIAGAIAPVIAVIVGVPLLTALIFLIISNSTYVVPPAKTVLEGSEVVVSPYISVIKTPLPAGPFENSELPLPVTYTITITAKQGALSNISIEYKCGVVKDGPTVSCPPTDPLIPEGIQIPEIISSTNPFVFSYTVIYDSTDFTDSLITDTITVTADAPEKPNQKAAGSATIVIGDPPDECPQGWPVMPEGGEASIGITQGPHGPFSHSTIEAIDFGVTTGHAVTARHSGTAFVTYTSNAYRPIYIDVHSICNGKEFFSRYAHLSVAEVQNGEAVTMEQVIGRSGTNGTGPHLHYEFRGLKMTPPYIPRVVPYGCNSRETCGYIP